MTKILLAAINFPVNIKCNKLNIESNTVTILFKLNCLSILQIVFEFCGA